MENLNMNKIVNILKNGRKIEAIKTLRNNAAITEETERTPARLALKQAKEIVDCIDSLLKPYPPDVIDLVNDTKDAGLYWSVWNNLTDYQKNDIRQEIDDHARKSATSKFRKLIKEYTNYIQRRR